MLAIIRELFWKLRFLSNWSYLWKFHLLLSKQPGLYCSFEYLRLFGCQRDSHCRSLHLHRQLLLERRFLHGLRNKLDEECRGFGCFMLLSSQLLHQRNDFDCLSCRFFQTDNRL